MRYRLAEILSPEDLGASGTKTIDITGKDIISRIEVKFGALNAGNTVSDHPAANITRLELVDGSDILFSLTGKCAQALDFYNTGKEIWNAISGHIGAYQECIVAINFGRYLWDPDLAFDPTKFTNPQLKISFNRSAAMAACVAASCKVDSFIFDELVPTPAGFLMTKEHYTYSPDASAFEHIELPRDYVLRRMALQTLTLDSDVGGLISQFKLSEDNDKRIPFDTTFMEEYRRYVGKYGFYTEYIYTHSDPTPVTIFVTPGMVAFGWAIDITAGSTQVVTPLEGCAVGFKSSAGGPMVHAKISGYLPHAVWDFPFGQQQIIEDWYDATVLGSLRFRVKAGGGASSSDTFRLLTQQNRTY